MDMHQNTTLYMFPNYNEWSGCDTKLEVSFWNTKVLWPWNAYKDIQINAATLKNTQNIWNNTKWHLTTKTTLDTAMKQGPKLECSEIFYGVVAVVATTTTTTLNNNKTTYLNYMKEKEIMKTSSIVNIQARKK